MEGTGFGTVKAGWMVIGAFSPLLVGLFADYGLFPAIGCGWNVQLDPLNHPVVSAPRRSTYGSVVNHTRQFNRRQL